MLLAINFLSYIQLLLLIYTSWCFIHDHKVLDTIKLMIAMWCEDEMMRHLMTQINGKLVPKMKNGYGNRFTPTLIETSLDK